MSLSDVTEGKIFAAHLTITGEKAFHIIGTTPEYMYKNCTKPFP